MLKTIIYTAIFSTFSVITALPAFTQDNNFGPEGPGTKTIVFVCDGEDEYFRERV